MKKKVLFWTLATMLLLSCKSVNNHISKYNKEKKQLNNWALDLGDYFYKENRYYNSVEQLFDKYKNDSDYISFIEKRIVDPFAFDKQFLKYIPIYDRTSTQPIACIFLSVGEDGVLNNNITQKLHIDDWYKEINAYNLDEVKQEIEKFTIKYPVFNRNNGQEGWYMVNVDEPALQNKKILLKGDSLFRGSFNTNNMDEFSSPRRPFVYKKYSITRKVFGNKDYIVNWGCRVVEYEIENLHSDQKH